MLNITKITQVCEEKYKHLEFIYSDYKDLVYAICHYPNGRYYVFKYDSNSPEAALESQEKVKEYLGYSMRCVWESSDRESFAGNEKIVYSTDFYLTNPVIDFDAAEEYLLEDDMTEYLKSDLSISASTRDKVKFIEWQLDTESKGHVIVETNSKLSESESKEISKWISGQNSDGIGEGFEQQDFAIYYEDEYGDITLDMYDEDGKENIEIIASFDWETNDYELIEE